MPPVPSRLEVREPLMPVPLGLNCDGAPRCQSCQIVPLRAIGLTGVSTRVIYVCPCALNGTPLANSVFLGCDIAALFRDLDYTRYWKLRLRSRSSCAMSVNEHATLSNCMSGILKAKPTPDFQPTWRMQENAGWHASLWSKGSLARKPQITIQTCKQASHKLALNRTVWICDSAEIVFHHARTGRENFLKKAQHCGPGVPVHASHPGSHGRC